MEFPRRSRLAAASSRASWCKQCKAVEPVLAKLAHWARAPAAFSLRPSHSRAQHFKTRFVIADADFLPETASDIRYTPTICFFQRGRKTDEFVGTNETMLRDRVWLWSD